MTVMVNSIDVETWGNMGRQKYAQKGYEEGKKGVWMEILEWS